MNAEAGEGAGAARLPMVPVETNDPILAPLFARIKAQSGAVVNMHRTVAHSPAVFRAYVELAYALRFASELPRRERELLILRATQLAGGDYEFEHHRVFGLAHGLTEAQIGDLSTWRNSDRFGARDRAILAYADAMDGACIVGDDVFAALQAHFTAKEIVELTLTAGFYALGSRVTRALRIPLEADIAHPPAP